jgi:DNA-binding transcriptional regulator YiaG
MTGEQLRKLREELGLTPTQAAAAVAVSARTWSRWEASAKPVPPPMQKLISLTLRRGASGGARRAASR